MKKQRKPRVVWVLFDSISRDCINFRRKRDADGYANNLNETESLFGPYTVEKYVREVKQGKK
jgi:hypothetical protein